MNTDQLAALVVPLINSAGLVLYDVEELGATVRVSVDGHDGVPFDALERLAREISLTLDEIDPTAGSYTLEVSSPGVERSLRTAAHFAGALGEMVTIKTKPGPDGRLRYRGELSAADHDGVVVVDDESGTVGLALDEIESARTIFEWGEAATPPKPKSPNTRSRGGRRT